MAAGNFKTIHDGLRRKLRRSSSWKKIYSESFLTPDIIDRNIRYDNRLVQIYIDTILEDGSYVDGLSSFYREKIDNTINVHYPILFPPNPSGPVYLNPLLRPPGMATGIIEHSSSQRFRTEPSGGYTFHAYQPPPPKRTNLRTNAQPATDLVPIGTQDGPVFVADVPDSFSTREKSPRSPSPVPIISDGGPSPLPNPPRRILHPRTWEEFDALVESIERRVRFSS